MVNGGYSLHSETLGLEVRLDEDRSLRLHDPETGEDLHAHEEMRERVIAWTGWSAETVSRHLPVPSPKRSRRPGLRARSHLVRHACKGRPR